MRKLLAVVLVLLLVGVGVRTTLAQAALTETYTEPDGSFSVMYPAGWEVKDESGPLVSFLTPSGAPSFIYGVLFYGDYNGATSLDGFRDLWPDPEAAGHTLNATQIAGHDAYRVDQPYENGTTFSIELAIDFAGTFIVLDFQGGEKGLDAEDVATIQAIAGSLQVPAGSGSAPVAQPTAAPTSDTAVAPESTSATTSEAAPAAESASALEPLTETYVSSNGSLSVNYPAGWSVLGVPDQATVALWSHEDPIEIEIAYPQSTGLSPKAVLGDGETVTELQIGARDAAKTPPFVSGKVSATAYAIGFDESNAYVSVYLYGDVAQALEPLALAIMASIQVPAAEGAATTTTAPAATLPTFSETYTSKDGTYSLESPLGWHWSWYDDESGAGSLYYLAGTITADVRVSPVEAGVTAAGYVADLLAEAGVPAEMAQVTPMELEGTDAIRLDIQELHLSVILIAFPEAVAELSFTGNDEVLQQVDPLIQAIAASVRVPASVEESAAAFAGALAALPPVAAATTAAPATGDDTALVTATDGTNTVSVRVPDAWRAQAIEGSPSIALFADSPIGGDIRFEASAQAGGTPREIASRFTSFITGTVTDIQINGRDAARLDGTSNSGTVLYIVVTTAAGDRVLASFSGPDADMKADEATLLGIAASVTSGDPDAAEAATTAPADAAPTTEAGGAGTVTCTVSAPSNANLRSGPGTTFARAGSLAAGQSQMVTGQAQGADGFLWLRLDDGNWVRSDVVAAAGDCDALPEVAP